MKILLATHQYFPDYIGGTEVYTLGIARRLKKRSEEVAVVTYVESASPLEKDFGITEVSYEGVVVYRIHYNLSVDPDPIEAEYNNKRVAAYFGKILAGFQPDLVHFTHGMKLSGSALKTCYDAGIPYLVSLTDFWFICPRHTLLKWDGSLCAGPRSKAYCLKCLHHTHGFFSPKIMSFPQAMLTMAASPAGQQLLSVLGVPTDIREEVWKRNAFLKEQLLYAREIIALSDFQKEMFIKNGYPPGSIRVLRHGLESPERYAGKKRTEEGTLSMLMVTSVVHYKGVHIALRALRRSTNDRLRLFIYGDFSGEDGYRKEMLTLAAEDDRVHLMGTVPEEQLGEVYSLADVFLMPVLWYENEPLVVKAALQAGLPVMASNIGSLPEMVHEGKNGYLLPPGDVETWAKAFDSLDRDTLGALNVKTAAVRSMDENFEELYLLYKKVME